MATWTLKEKSVGDMIVTIEGEEWKKAVNKAFKKLAKNLELPGFRKGSAPISLAEKRIPAAERFLEAVNDNANEWMRNGLKELGLSPITQPQLDIKDVNEEKVELVYTFTVEPEAKVGDYKALEYKVEDYTVTDDEVNEEIGRMQNQYADMEVKEGEAENGDTVNIDYKGLKDGVAFDGGTANGYDLELGSGSFIPGFEEQLIGVKAGDEKSLNLSFPADYHAEDLAGAEVVFEVKVNEVKTKSIPALDDDFAKELNIKGVETVEDLNKNVRERLETRKKNDAENKAQNDLMEAFAEIVDVDIPDVMIEDEVQGQINQLANQLQQYGMSLTSYLQMMGQSADDLKASYRDQAAKTVKIRLGLEAVAKAENLEPSAEEIQKQYEEIAEQYGMKVDEVKTYISEDMIRTDVRNMKAMELLRGESAAE
ncbi:MAG: trigger factor [Erysipelotrichaceae bacterium]|nr:trigger factor [Erysipelotrichaceae bacterium]